ncbi:MAG: hypothetical protein CL917_16840 [Deltaproteobacteria bacterium]|nr:hypothetical protein [Deltaproteobacteria bacterium]
MESGVLWRRQNLVRVRLLLFGLIFLWGGVSVQAMERGADGEFDQRHSSHFILYQDVDIDQTSGFHGSRRFEQRVLEVLESAYLQLDGRLGLRPPGPIEVIVYDPVVFQQRFAGLFRFPAAGFYGGQVHIRGDTQLTPALSRVLSHELVHVAMASEVSDYGLPGWFNEGVAEWFEARVVGQRKLSVQERVFLQSAAKSGQLFSLQELSAPAFGAFGPSAAQLAYLESYAFITYLAREYSEVRLREWIREMARTRNIERSSRRVFKVELSRLEERFIDELVAGGR